jgi:hypothetical protein
MSFISGKANSQVLYLLARFKIPTPQPLVGGGGVGGDDDLRLRNLKITKQKNLIFKYLELFSK